MTNIGLKVIEQALEILIDIQRKANRDYYHEGIFPSERNYGLLNLSRPDDNVYFTAYILHILKTYKTQWENTSSADRLCDLIAKAEKALEVYRHGNDNVSFNYYRAHGYFPNGKILSKFKHFKPANDADDSSVAFLGLDFERVQAQRLRERFAYHANGERDRWVKRVPKAYRQFKTYNTWLGTDKLYVDLDLGVLCNILQFVAKYRLPISNYELEAVGFLEQAISSGDYLNKSHLIAAWYPDKSVIVYFMSRVLRTGYYNFSQSTKDQLKSDVFNLQAHTPTPVQKMLLESALCHLGYFQSKHTVSLEEVLAQNGFSIGVIPVLHPWNSELAQKLGKYNSLRVTYTCKALQVALWLERVFLNAGNS